MSTVEEEFFVNQIKNGLKLLSKSLSSEEETLLLTNMTELQEKSLSTEAAQDLQEKCSEALSAAYRSDTSSSSNDVKELKRLKRSMALLWRDYNEKLYQRSKYVLSGIVQNWYLSEGRSLEKKAAGCMSVIVIALLILSITFLTI